MKARLTLAMIALVLMIAMATAPAPALAEATTATPTAPAPMFALVNVPDKGVVNLRSGPGREHARVGALSAQMVDVPLTGNVAGEWPRVWYEVRRTGGGVGWVGGHYVTEYRSPADFCADARAKTLVETFGKAFIEQNGETLGKLVSPLHGMTVRLFRTGTAVNYLWYAPVLFKSDYRVNWGAPSGSLKPVVGAFPDAFTPRLQSVFKSAYTMACNDASAVSSPGVSPWPPEYANINFYAVTQPASADGKEKPSTWLIGVDYVDGVPYIFAIIFFPQ